MRGKATELLRDLGILLQRCSPLSRSAFAAAERIYVATPASLRLVPRKWRFKTTVHLAVATDSCATRDEQQLATVPRFLFVGRLVHWKGAHFAIRALAETRKAIPAATLTLIGTGPDELWLRNVAKRVGMADAVEFVGYLPRQQLIGLLRGYKALVFPSLHDSGGIVVLEALSEGLPVVCLDLGGPGTVVNESCGIVVPTENADETQTIGRISNAMISLGTMPDVVWRRLSAGATAKANELSWDSLTGHVAMGVNREDSEAETETPGQTFLVHLVVRYLSPMRDLLILITHLDRLCVLSTMSVQ
jgi:glycosyltransferase involved in cell wall biosynthesis